MVPAPPDLNAKCDLALQTAFRDGKWSSAATMAKRHFLKSKDSYFQAIELAARSQLEDHNDQEAAWHAVQVMLKNGTYPRDFDSLRLYDWACISQPVKWPQTLGVLYANFIKAVPSDIQVYSPALYTCIMNGDWEHAQQVAVISEKLLAKDRRYHFRTILITYIFSTKLPVKDPRKALFQKLAQKQIEKARELRDATPLGEDYPDRAIITEEEMILWLEIQINTANSAYEAIRTFQKPERNAIRSLEQGHLAVFKKIMDFLEQNEAWDEIFKISNVVIREGLEYMVAAAKGDKTKTDVTEKTDSNEVVKMSLGDRKAASQAKEAKKQAEERSKELTEAKAAAKSSAFCGAVMDWALWTQFLTAASKQTTKSNGLKQLKTFLDKLPTADIRPIHHKQLALARLRILFGRTLSKQKDKQKIDSKAASQMKSQTRIEALIDFVRLNFRHISCFENLTPFLELLEFEEVGMFLTRMSEESSKALADSDNDKSNATRAIMLAALRSRFRYFFTTSHVFLDTIPGSYHVNCLFPGCNSVIKEDDKCMNCLNSITKACADIFKGGVLNEGLHDGIRKKLDEENLNAYADITIIGVMCLLKVAKIDSGPNVWHLDHLKPLLQAIMWLHTQFVNNSKHNSRVAIILVQLYLRIGCISIAEKIWDTLAVKNVTLNSLGPLFSDRLASMAPGMWGTPAGRPKPMVKYVKHFETSIRSSIPRALREALDLGNYESVLGLLNLRDRLESSCTLAMAAVEENRGFRAIGSKEPYDVINHPLMDDLLHAAELVNPTDYSSLANHESNLAKPIQDLISNGPRPTVERSRLSLLAESFLSQIRAIDPKESKPTKPADVAGTGRSAHTSFFIFLHFRMAEMLNTPNIKSKITPSEESYYGVIYNLCSLATVSMEKSPHQRVLQSDHAKRVVHAIVKIFDEKLEELSIPDGQKLDPLQAFRSFSSLHNLGMLRESIFAVNATLAMMDKLFVAEKSLPKWMAEVKSRLTSKMTEATNFLKTHIMALRNIAFQPGWIDQLLSWTFDSINNDTDAILFETIGRAGCEVWAADVVESWQQVMKGWTIVKFD